jgi:hypothetical protein
MLAAGCAVLWTGIASAWTNPNDHYVGGYWRGGGYVQPHYRTNPNGTRLDNFGTQGNFNSHNGQWGTQPAYPMPTWRNPSPRVWR